MSFLTNLNWRYATKKFDTSRKVSDADLDTIIEAIRLTPTSFGLQPYHFYVIENQAIKDAIKPVASNQDQIDTCSHLIIFAARSDLMTCKDEYFDLMTGGDSEIRAKMKGFEDMLTGAIVAKTEAGTALDWAARQAYIAHGFALAAAAELEIDSCAMEGADFDAVGRILGLPDTQRALVLLPIGYRAEGEGPRSPEKVRFSKESLFTVVR
jgi:nitroreductase